jgi:hypothetical protein
VGVDIIAVPDEPPPQQTKRTRRAEPITKRAAKNGSITVPARGVKPVTVRSTLTTFGMVIESFVDQGALPRNVIALVERPADAIIDETSGTSKS